MEFALYRAAIAADDRFHAHVVRVYGKERAGDMRYRSKEWTDPELIRAAEEKHLADSEWRDEVRRNQEDSRL